MNLEKASHIHVKSGEESALFDRNVYVRLLLRSIVLPRDIATEQGK